MWPPTYISSTSTVPFSFWSDSSLRAAPSFPRTVDVEIGCVRAIDDGMALSQFTRRVAKTQTARLDDFGYGSNLLPANSPPLFPDVGFSVPKDRMKE